MVHAAVQKEAERMLFQTREGIRRGAMNLDRLDQWQ
jgi:hypothetical protein